MTGGGSTLPLGKDDSSPIREAAVNSTAYYSKRRHPGAAPMTIRSGTRASERLRALVKASEPDASGRAPSREGPEAPQHGRGAGRTGRAPDKSVSRPPREPVRAVGHPVRVTE